MLDGASVSGAAALAAEIGRRLSADGHRIAVAESLTGGLLVQALAKVQGSGDWLTGGVVAYQSAVKHCVLGVEARNGGLAGGRGADGYRACGASSAPTSRSP